MTYTFTVPGRPVAYVRMTRRGKYNQPDAQRYLAYKELVGWSARQAGVQKMPGAVEVRVTAHLRNKGYGMDGDNLLKACLDALQGISYDNDRSVRRGSFELVHGAKEDLLTVFVSDLT